jgi:ABC-type phosphate transport system substrate-binding protein
LARRTPLPPDQLSATGLAQFPVVIGGVVPVYNIEGVDAGQIRFTGVLLADIYLGKIKRWNDPAIAAVNPGVKLPGLFAAGQRPVRRRRSKSRVRGASMLIVDPPIERQPRQLGQNARNARF